MFAPIWTPDQPAVDQIRSPFADMRPTADTAESYECDCDGGCDDGNIDNY